LSDISVWLLCVACYGCFGLDLTSHPVAKQLTHRSVTVSMVLSILTPLLLELYRGADLRESLERAMSRLRPPACSGRMMHDSYVSHRGPGNIPRHEKWLQHVVPSDQDFYPAFLHEMLALDDDEDVAGFGDRPNSRLSTACYCEHAFSVVLYLCYRYGEDPQKAMLKNAMLGGHSTARGSVMGAILGAAHPRAVPFVEDLCARAVIEVEIKGLVDTIG
jgi:ADP-ribosylglycohydrolase